MTGGQRKAANPPTSEAPPVVRSPSVLVREEGGRHGPVGLGDQPEPDASGRLVDGEDPAAVDKCVVVGCAIVRIHEAPVPGRVPGEGTEQLVMSDGGEEPPGVATRRPMARWRDGGGDSGGGIAGDYGRAGDTSDDPCLGLRLADLLLGREGISDVLTSLPGHLSSSPTDEHGRRGARVHARYLSLTTPRPKTRGLRPPNAAGHVWENFRPQDQRDPAKDAVYGG